MHKFQFFIKLMDAAILTALHVHIFLLMLTSTKTMCTTILSLVASKETAAVWTLANIESQVQKSRIDRFWA